MLDIDTETSEQYRAWIRKGYSGIKPGWCRVSLHFVMDECEVDYIIDAVEFIATCGDRFLGLYRFDLATGAWVHKEDQVCLEPFSLEAALECCGPAPTVLEPAERAVRYARFLEHARELAAALGEDDGGAEMTMDAALDRLRFFSVPSTCARGHD